MSKRRKSMLMNILTILGIIVLGFITLDLVIALAIIIAAKIKDIREDRRLMKKMRDRS